MGDVDERDPERLLDALELDLQVHAQARVQRAQRLVEQQHRRLQHDRPRQRDALLLAARELPRPARLQPAELDHLHRLADAPRALGLA